MPPNHRARILSGMRKVFRIPPPATFAVVFLVGLWIEAALYRIWLVDDVETPRWLFLSGAALIVVGSGLALWAMVTFARAQTPIMPYQRASRMVTAGPYGVSRNPMYLGMALVHIGASLMLNAGWPLLLLPVALGLLYVLVIRGEEALMHETFGEEFVAYRGRVRRWF